MASGIKILHRPLYIRRSRLISRYLQTEPWTVQIDRTVLSETIYIYIYIRIKQRRGSCGFVFARPLLCFPSIDVWIAITGSGFVLYSFCRCLCSFRVRGFGAHPLGWIWDCLVLFFCCNGDRVAFPASSAKSSILRFSGGFS